MIGRTSLVEQKRIQWAKEREELARLGGSWGLLKNNVDIRTNIRNYSNNPVRMSLTEAKDRRSGVKPFRAVGHYGSSGSLKSLATESSGNGESSFKCLDCNRSGGGSLINLHEQSELSRISHRSPSLPPIYNKDQQQYLCQSQQRDFSMERSQYQLEKQDHRSYDGYEKYSRNYVSQNEEREGETSGYASDSVDVPVSTKEVASVKGPEENGAERTWQNPYHTTPESSLPPSRLSAARIGELNRPRWGSVWGQETGHVDPPTPTWLSRLGQSSQVLVINHESASSSDSSTIGSENNKTYLRGQNIPVQAEILQEREVKRQKALELQNAIMKQLQEKDRLRKEEKERRLREERLEEERIKREREKEKERFEEEQRRLKEREAAKLRQAEAMREVLEAAEKLAKEQKKSRRRCERNGHEVTQKETESVGVNEIQNDLDRSNIIPPISNDSPAKSNEKGEEKVSNEEGNNDDINVSTSSDTVKDNGSKDTVQDTSNTMKSVQVPVSKDVAIVLSGRLEDSELLNKANLQLVNLVLTPTPRKLDSGNLSASLNTLIHRASNASGLGSTIVENRLLTPSKYRVSNGRDFGTQTDVENDLQDFREGTREVTAKDQPGKERKDIGNVNKRDTEKSLNVGSTDEMAMKTLSRLKPRPRRSVQSRPQWNANRPGTRYRTQSEKDPHYQRRLRLRKRQVDSSDERSRSPSPDRRKLQNVKSEIRTANRSKGKMDNYDADLSMDSLNSIVPLRTDNNGRIIIEEHDYNKVRSIIDDVNESDNANNSRNENSNVWCGEEILSKLSTLKNGLLLKQLEWDKERCLVSPAASEVF